MLIHSTSFLCRELLAQLAEHFKRIFVCLCFLESFAALRRFIAADGTFLEARFILFLLLAVGIGANGETVVLA